MSSPSRRAQTELCPLTQHKISRGKLFGTKQLELIQASLKTGNPEYAQKTEVGIKFLHDKYPDKVRRSRLSPRPSSGVHLTTISPRCRVFREAWLRLHAVSPAAVLLQVAGS